MVLGNVTLKSIASLTQPLHPLSLYLYVMSGFSSTVIMVTLGSILGGRGIWIWYFCRSTPTRMPSSMSVGATRSPRPTTNLAICLMLITYLAFSVLGSMILVQRATCRGCSSCRACLSETRSHREGWASPMSDSLMPATSITRWLISFRSVSSFLMREE